ncbi:unnamed protein product [Periconia digitata]|uniref:NAD-dependent epimerase/dehydratase domain-containing protein n=1 Tax=Periconia digitata TaxID=1303443 RepID=A0A9W4XRX0_9PLEO|nr:unnamed protein product [Periconia digitata]
MSKGTVLISGINGYIAAVTAQRLLDAGYSVRGTVRKSSSATALIEGPLKKYFESGAFEVVEVPDITVDGAFDEAVKGVTTIAHLATPVSFHFKDPAPILHAAIQGTRSILASAQKAGPQLQSFIHLSSIVAILTNAPAPSTLTEADWNTWAEPMISQGGDNISGVVIYGASKTASERALWAFRDEQKPNFTITALNPVYVIGPPLISPKTPKDVGETVAPVWTVFSGASYATGASAPHPTVDVRDVADLVGAVITNAKQCDGQRYIARGASASPQAMADVLRKTFPEAKDRIIEGEPGVGYEEDYQVDPQKGVVIDSDKAKTLLGRDWISFERSVVDTAKAFVHLL